MPHPVIKFFLNNILIIIPALLVLLIVLLLFSKLRIIIKYRLKNDTNILILEFFLWKIRIFKVKRDFKKPAKKKKSIKESKKGLKSLIPGFIPSAIKILREMNFEEIENIITIVNFGAGEAHYTAVLSGYIYALAGIFYALAAKFGGKIKKSGKKIIKVNCLFNDFRFELFFDCIVRTKGVNIIKVIYMLLKEKKEGKTEGSKNERASYSGTYEHSNAKY